MSKDCLNKNKKVDPEIVKLFPIGIKVKNTIMPNAIGKVIGHFLFRDKTMLKIEMDRGEGSWTPSHTLIIEKVEDKIQNSIDTSHSF